MEKLLKESKEKSRKGALRALAAGISGGSAAAGSTVEKIEGPNLWVTEVPEEHIALNVETGSLYVDPSAHLHPGACYIPAVMPTLGSSGTAAAAELLGSVGSADATLSHEVIGRKAARRARISAMTRGAVQVLDLGRLLAYDEISSSLPFQLKTLTTVLKAGRIEYMLAPFTARSLFNLATSDDPGFPYPPPLHLNNRDDHAITGDSVKGRSQMDPNGRRCRDRWRRRGGPTFATGSWEVRICWGSLTSWMRT